MDYPNDLLLKVISSVGPKRQTWVKLLKYLILNVIMYQKFINDMFPFMYTVNFFRGQPIIWLVSNQIWSQSMFVYLIADKLKIDLKTCCFDSDVACNLQSK